MDKPEEEPGQSGLLPPKDDDCYILNLDSSSSEDSLIENKETLKRPASCMVIDSESNDESGHDKKKAKIWELSSEDEDLEEISDTEEPITTEKSSAVIVIEDDDDNKISVQGSELKEGKSSDKGHILKIKKEMVDDEYPASQYSSPDKVGKKQDIDLSLSDSEAVIEIPDTESSGGKAASKLEQPKKRKGKSKNICMTPGKPADSGRQKRGPSQKKSIATKVDKYKIGKSLCKIPGCFLSDIVKSKQYCGRKFKQNKDELVEKIYTLLNHTVFGKKLPKKIEILWNKKMLRTAGLCITNERRKPKRERRAKIAISLKVCDSADRIRDTLVHEVCHAASWLIDGIRDSHGASWQYYAKKCNTIHPELPKVTRCHNYRINYKIYYECTLCKYRVGRYTKSLNTDRFICARCRGPLVLLPLFRKDGTPIVPHVRPFAKYVQENYRAVFKGTAGMSHGDVMKRLSKDYFAKKRRKRR